MQRSAPKPLTEVREQTDLYDVVEMPLAGENCPQTPMIFPNTPDGALGVLGALGMLAVPQKSTLAGKPRRSPCRHAAPLADMSLELPKTPAATFPSTPMNFPATPEAWALMGSQSMPGQQALADPSYPLAGDTRGVSTSARYGAQAAMMHQGPYQGRNMYDPSALSTANLAPGIAASGQPQQWFTGAHGEDRSGSIHHDTAACLPRLLGRHPAALPPWVDSSMQFPSAYKPSAVPLQPPPPSVRQAQQPSLHAAYPVPEQPQQQHQQPLMPAPPVYFAPAANQIAPPESIPAAPHWHAAPFSMSGQQQSPLPPPQQLHQMQQMPTTTGNLLAQHDARQQQATTSFEQVPHRGAHALVQPQPRQAARGWKPGEVSKNSQGRLAQVLDLDSSLAHNQPRLGSPELPTAGSADHHRGQCKPCAFVNKGLGCVNGIECHFCHLCEPGEKKRRQKEKRQMLKAKRAAAAEARATAEAAAKAAEVELEEDAAAEDDAVSAQSEAEEEEHM